MANNFKSKLKNFFFEIFKKKRIFEPKKALDPCCQPNENRYISQGPSKNVVI